MSQTYHDFEWLLIENGSTDGTRDIIRKYAQLDDRIKVEYFEKNRTGFANDYIQEKAKGEYIVKLDSDDWIEPDYLERLVYPMETDHVDMAVCGALNYEQETGEEEPHEYGELNDIYFVQDIKIHYIEMYSYMGTYWAKIMRLDIFKKVLPQMSTINNELKVGDGYGGDTAFVLCYFSQCNSIAFINKKMYHYRLHSGSATVNTVSTNRLECYLILREIEKNFLHIKNAGTKENIVFVELIFWLNMDQMFKSIIKTGWPISKKIKALGEVCADCRVKQIRKENFNSKIRKIIATYTAWCYMNMNNDDGECLKNMLILLEPDIFESISNEAYEWMRKDQTLMSYIIMGEFIHAQEYIKQISIPDNEGYIQELQKRL